MKDLLLLPLKKIGHVLAGTWVYLGSLAAMALLVGTLGMALYRMMEWRLIGGDAEFYYGVMNPGSAEIPTGVAAVPEEVRHAGTHSCIRFEYGDDGRLQRFVHLNAEGEVCTIPGSAIASQVMTYDGQGRLLRKQNLDAQGKPAADAAGVSTRLFAYDEKGNLVRTETMSADGALVAPRVPGYAVEVVSYDDQRRPVLREYQDAYGKPVLNTWGESRVVYHYDDEAGVSTRENYVEGELVENHLGYAIERREVEPDGRHTTVSWLDAQGVPVVNQGNGAAFLSMHREPQTGYCREHFSVADPVVPEPARGCSERLSRYDQQGRLEWECFNAADGLPCLHPCLGYAERICRYGADGGLQAEYFWDAGGHPATCYEKRYSRASGGDDSSVLSLFCDGSTSVQPSSAHTKKTELAAKAHPLP